MSKSLSPLQIALYGMDERSSKTMSMYLKGPCKGKAIIVNDQEAEVDLLDADHVQAKVLLDECQQKNPQRPLILLSLETLSISDTIYVKKPVQTADLLQALEQARLRLNGKQNKRDKPSNDIDVNTEGVTEPARVVKAAVVDEKRQAAKHIDKEEIKKTAKHRTATDLTESGFSSYIGFVEGVDFSDPQQVLTASYNPKDYFQGYVQSAIKIAADKRRALTLNSGWKALILFPETEEVWLDADEKLLRAFAGLSIRNNPLQEISLLAAEPDKLDLQSKMENFWEMDGFLWKLAAWTSKGRYPEAINIDQPLYLKQWPNFTRLLVTPHAMRIAALMIMSPRTALSIAEVLKIKPQYVFVFISAAHATGLIGQIKRQSDDLIATTSEIKPSKRKGLLSRILGRLRG